MSTTINSFVPTFSSHWCLMLCTRRALGVGWQFPRRRGYWFERFCQHDRHSWSRRPGRFGNRVFFSTVVIKQILLIIHVKLWMALLSCGSGGRILLRITASGRQPSGNVADHHPFLYSCCIAHWGIVRKIKYEPLSPVRLVTNTIAGLQSVLCHKTVTRLKQQISYSWQFGYSWRPWC